MSNLAIEPFVIPAAHLGGENPLAPLRPYETASAAGAPINRHTEENYPDRGNEASILPYRLQDQYDRSRSPRAFRAAVLENEHLRATFVLELGGRMWSLIDKTAGRELLYANSVFQPANLAVRDAWFCGGVEWNISIIGHCPFTCSPLFAARVLDDDGTPVLRMYEFERIRRVLFQIDSWLPSGSKFLMVRVRIVNANDHTVPMYWWSNIAVPEQKHVRVISPAGNAWRHDYDGRLVGHNVPILEGVDVTYATNRASAADLYFRIPDRQRPWIAALDGEGRGLVQTSTERLRGRKMFNFGVDPGGRRWQAFLAEPGRAYLEIQGGLATTQSDYIPMPGRAQWEWLEAYGAIEVDRKLAHGSDWRAACEAVERELATRLDYRRAGAELLRSSKIAERAPVEILHIASGWGALENRRRRTVGQAPIGGDAMPFPDESLSDEQSQWLALLEQGRLPDRAACEGPGSFMVQPEWHALLGQSVQRTGGDWLSWYHLGVMRFRGGDIDGARAAWEKSFSIEPSPWAKRDLAVLAREAGNHHAAADQWVQAARMARKLVPLAIEACQALMRAERYRALIDFVASLPQKVRSAGRIRLLHAMASLQLDDFAAVDRYFRSDLDIANIREGERILSDLWFGWHEKLVARKEGVPIDHALRVRVRHEFPPPLEFDFRLNPVIDSLTRADI